MNFRNAWAGGLALVLAVACVPDPVKSGDRDASSAGGQGGSIAIMSGEGGAGGDVQSGAAGDTGGGGTTGAAGTSGAAGTNGAAGDTGPNDDGGADVAEAAVDIGPAQTIDGCDRANWTFTPSVVCTTGCAGMSNSAKLPANAIDGDPSTRYTTGVYQGSKGPENVVLSFAVPVSLTGITLYAKSSTDFPAMYLVEYSTDGTTFMGFSPAISGPGATTLIIPFPGRTTLRAVRITQTGTAPHWWSINELNVAGCTAP
jgi:hypothetical protein